MFGMLGLDYGIGFDEVPFSPGVNTGQFHFILGQQF
jgi:outer membrane protein insertion porin family